MLDTIFYFGCGATRAARLVAAIIGKPVSQLAGRPGVLQDYILAVQRLDQVPDVVAAGSAVPVSPQALLRANWDEGFESYVIIPKPGGRVAGIIWELTPDERARMAAWELVDFGWYQPAQGQAVTADGKTVAIVTEKMGDGQAIDREADGLDYETWLQPPEKFRRIAEEARRKYNEALHRRIA